MKKLLIFLLLCGSILLANNGYAAMSASITWEFNASATANMVNGGGFKTGASGVDKSRTTGAHLTIADLQSDAANNLLVHSDLTPFDSEDVGNVLHITATGTGFTVGWYEVTAVSADAIPIATLDRSCGGVGLSGGTAYLGGALSLNSTLDFEFLTQLVAGQKVYFLKGTYTLGEAASGGSGSATLPIYMTGYTGTRDTACNGIDRPLITCGANGFSAGNYWQIKNLSFTGTSSPVLGVGSVGIAINCKAVNYSITASRVAISSGTILNCEGISMAGFAFQGFTALVGSYGHHSLIGAKIINYDGVIVNSILSNNRSYAFTVAPTRVVTIMNNIFYGSESKIGVGMYLASNYGQLIINNIIYGFTDGIINDAADARTYIDYNNLYNITTPVTNVTELSNDIAADPKFVNAAGTLISDCETQWSYADGDVTLTADGAVYKVGTKSMKAVCGANLGAGDIACANAITSTNMSTYDGIGVWVQSTVALAANDWQLLLSDQANCANIILAYNLPAMAASTWYWLYLGNQDMSTATVIISIGFKQVVDKGAMTLYADDVRGCDNDFTATGATGGAIGKGFPQSMPGVVGDYQANIGVDQDDNAAGGTSNDVFGLVD